MWSKGNVVVVVGDFNSCYIWIGDMGIWDLFVSENFFGF